MQRLETRIPPPVIMVTLALLAFLVARATSAGTYAFSGQRLLALTAIMMGLALNLLPKLTFRRAGTTVNPLRPGASTQLVTTGIYRVTRNPMYLGHAVMLLGWTVFLGSLWALLAVPAYVALITRLQIKPEERTLAMRFPEYGAYRGSTRRWL